MIRLRCGGWHHPAGTTGRPWRPLFVDQVPIKILRTDSRLIPSSWLRRRTDLLGLWTTESDSSNVVWCPWWFRSSRVWLSVSVFMIEVMHSPMGSELVDPSADQWVDRKSRHPNRSLNCNWAAWMDFCRKYASTINIFCSVVHGISKVKFGRLLEH